jgi:hypothetical protein
MDIPDAPQNLIGDNAYDSDLDKQLGLYGIEVIAPHRRNYGGGTFWVQGHSRNKVGNNRASRLEHHPQGASDSAATDGFAPTPPQALAASGPVAAGRDAAPSR